MTVPRRITYQERTQTISEWAKELGVDRTCLYYRLKHWTVEEAMKGKRTQYPNKHKPWIVLDLSL